jgi:glycerol-3-phosphate acyltransferase PlsY
MIGAAAWPIAVGYALGSIPFAWLVVKAATGVDLRRTGSGNVGAANALRATRWRTGVLVAALDVAKGSAAVACVAVAGGDGVARVLAALGAVVGHVAPVWLRFRGGKGVATAFGAFAVLAPAAAVMAGTVFAATLVATRIVSLASVAGAVTLVAGCVVGASPAPVRAGATAVAALVIARHGSNLQRLARGTERRLQ